MENEEKEDLLLEVSESEEEEYDKDEIDYYMEEKIRNFIHNDKPNNNSSKNTIVFVFMFLFLFLSSSVLIIVLPIYLKSASANSISTYSKLFTFSSVNAIIFVIAHIVGILVKCDSRSSFYLNLCLSDVLKISFFLSVGSFTVFWLSDNQYVTCHLQDPLKGCSIVFALLFYYLFSKKKISLERTFCAITVIVGVFVSVDFGICDKFHCNGNSNLNEVTPKLHLLYVIVYILAHGFWVLHFTFAEVCCSTYKSTDSGLNISVLSNVCCNGNSDVVNLKPSAETLSIIYQEEGEQESVPKKESSLKPKNSKKLSFFSKSQSKICSGKESEDSLSTPVPSFIKLSVPEFKKFPLTSTPNNQVEKWQSWSSGRSYDIALWEHLCCWFIIFSFCWLPTVSFSNDITGKYFADIINELFDSFHCHAGWHSSPGCNSLPLLTVLISISYVTLILSSIEILKTVQSTITIISLMMPALPISSIFWSLFRLNNSSNDLLEFNPAITGEAVCAVLGLPIIGIGIVLLFKSHVREFKLVV